MFMLTERPWMRSPYSSLPSNTSMWVFSPERYGNTVFCQLLLETVAQVTFRHSRRGAMPDSLNTETSPSSASRQSTPGSPKRNIRPILSPS